MLSRRERQRFVAARAEPLRTTYTAKVDGAAMTKYFARYDIHVVGPRPWQVVVAAHASKWLDGTPKPTELSDDNPPAWLVERRDHIVDDINSRLRGSAIAPR